MNHLLTYRTVTFSLQISHIVTPTLTAQNVKINPNSTYLAVLSRNSNQPMSLVVLVLEASSKISLNNLIIENISHCQYRHTAGQNQLTPVVLSRSSDQPMSLDETRRGNQFHIAGSLCSRSSSTLGLNEFVSASVEPLQTYISRLKTARIPNNNT